MTGIAYSLLPSILTKPVRLALSNARNWTPLAIKFSVKSLVCVCSRLQSISEIVTSVDVEKISKQHSSKITDQPKPLRTMNDLNRGVWVCAHHENIKRIQTRVMKISALQDTTTRIYKIVRNWCYLHLSRMFTVAANSALTVQSQLCSIPIAGLHKF